MRDALISCRLRATLAAFLLALACGGDAIARDAPAVAANPEIEARMMAMAAELRCVVCQNQTLADSHADLAADLRQQIREQLAAGKSEAEVRSWLTDRYGDFVLYRPPLKASTWVLWFGPGALMLLGLLLLVRNLRRRQRLGAESFDPDTDDPDEPSAARP